MTGAGGYRIAFLAAVAALLLLPVAAHARPKYAAAEGLPCAYCHLNPAGGGPRNYRGLYYALHNHSFVGFDDAAEAKRAGVAIGPAADRKPASLKPAEPAATHPATTPPFASSDGSVVPPITDRSSWRVVPEKTAAVVSVEGDALRIVVPVKPEQYLQLLCDLPQTPQNGARLIVHFQARADAPYRMYLLAQRDAWEEQDYAGIGLGENVEVGTEYRDYTFPWTVQSPHPARNKVAFVLNAPLGPNPKPVTLEIRAIRIVPADGAAPAASASVDPRNVPPFGRWHDPVAGVWFVKIPAGSYVRGTTPAQLEALKKLGLWSPLDSDELPARAVRITRPFLISETEVTQSEWRRAMTHVDGGRLAAPSAFKGDDRPVDSVSFDDAQLFCHTLRALAQAGDRPAVYRLPTEAEWEYAARAGSDGPLPLGVDRQPITPQQLGEYCWMSGTAPNATGTAGAKRPNAWGLYDMLGNVWEWCEDTYSPTAYATLPTVDPLHVHASDTERVFRGGCWFLDAHSVLPAQRGGNLPDFKSPYVGLRLVREIDLQTR